MGRLSDLEVVDISGQRRFATRDRTVAHKNPKKQLGLPAQGLHKIKPNQGPPHGGGTAHDVPPLGEGLNDADEGGSVFCRGVVT